MTQQILHIGEYPRNSKPEHKAIGAPGTMHTDEKIQKIARNDILDMRRKLCQKFTHENTESTNFTQEWIPENTRECPRY